jgi:hypothetical protein
MLPHEILSGGDFTYKVLGCLLIGLFVTISGATVGRLISATHQQGAAAD